MGRNRLIVITGPTGSGKTALAISLALRLGGEIICADSRQIYRDIPIGTAAPTADELAAAPHHLTGFLDLADYYSAARFEEDVMALLPEIWRRGHEAILCGGSMMYVDAVINGIDHLPDISPEIREAALRIYTERGIEAVRQELHRLDPDYYAQVDINNHKRMVHAIEITMQAGVPYSSLRSGVRKERDFDVIKMAIDFPRQQLFDRINRRVEAMIDAGMIDEARRVYPLRHLNSLNTVGYKELFAAFDGTMPMDIAIPRIAKNTRVYAKKQLTWLRRDDTVHWLPPTDTLEAALALL